MEQYIPKSDLVAEIEKLVDKGKYHEEYDCAYRDGNNGALYALKGKLNTLEVKDVNLEEYYHEFLQKEWFGNSHVRTVSEMMAFTAKHFFELGMAVSNKQIEEKENIDSLEEKCNTIYKDITMIDKDGNTIKAKIEQREKV